MYKLDPKELTSRWDTHRTPSPESSGSGPVRAASSASPACSCTSSSQGLLWRWACCAQPAQHSHTHTHVTFNRSVIVSLMFQEMKYAVDRQTTLLIPFGGSTRETNRFGRSAKAVLLFSPLVDQASGLDERGLVHYGTQLLPVSRSERLTCTLTLPDHPAAWQDNKPSNVQNHPIFPGSCSVLTRCFRFSSSSGLGSVAWTLRHQGPVQEMGYGYQLGKGKTPILNCHKSY